MTKYGDRWLNWAVQIEEEANCDVEAGIPLEHRGERSPMNTLYDQDFYLWTQKMSELIKNRQFDAVDWENIVEEIETLGRSEKRAVKSHLVILLLHLLKWQYQSEYRCRSWLLSVSNARRDLLDLLDENPSLKGDFFVESIPVAYEKAREKASDETTIFLENFPVECPYSVERVMQKDWLPS